MSYKRIAIVTVPSMSFKERTKALVRVLGKIVKGSDRVNEETGEESAPSIMRVCNLEDGNEYDLICPVLLVRALDVLSYDYVNHCYEVIVTPTAVPGKRYKGVEVYEIEDAEED